MLAERMRTALVLRLIPRRVAAYVLLLLLLVAAAAAEHLVEEAELRVGREREKTQGDEQHIQELHGCNHTCGGRSGAVDARTSDGR